MDKDLHYINRVTSILEYGSSESYNMVNSTVEEIIRNEIPKILEAELAKIAKTNEHIIIEHLEIDLEEFLVHEIQRIPEVFRQKLHQKLSHAIRQSAKLSETERVFAIIESYLKKGYLPWWIQSISKHSVNSSFVQAFEFDNKRFLSIILSAIESKGTGFLSSFSPEFLRSIASEAMSNLVTGNVGIQFSDFIDRNSNEEIRKKWYLFSLANIQRAQSEDYGFTLVRFIKHLGKVPAANLFRMLLEAKSRSEAKDGTGTYSAPIHIINLIEPYSHLLTGFDLVSSNIIFQSRDKSTEKLQVSSEGPFSDLRIEIPISWQNSAQNPDKQNLESILQNYLFEEGRLAHFHGLKNTGSGKDVFDSIEPNEGNRNPNKFSLDLSIPTIEHELEAYLKSRFHKSNSAALFYLLEFFSTYGRVSKYHRFIDPDESILFITGLLYNHSPDDLCRFIVDKSVFPIQYQRIIEQINEDLLKKLVLNIYKAPADLSHSGRFLEAVQITLGKTKDIKAWFAYLLSNIELASKTSFLHVFASYLSSSLNELEIGKLFDRGGAGQIFTDESLADFCTEVDRQVEIIRSIDKRQAKNAETGDLRYIDPVELFLYEGKITSDLESLGKDTFRQRILVILAAAGREDLQAYFGNPVIRNIVAPMLTQSEIARVIEVLWPGFYDLVIRLNELVSENRLERITGVFHDLKPYDLLRSKALWSGEVLYKKDPDALVIKIYLEYVAEKTGIRPEILANILRQMDSSSDKMDKTKVSKGWEHGFHIPLGRLVEEGGQEPFSMMDSPLLQSKISSEKFWGLLPYEFYSEAIVELLLGHSLSQWLADRKWRGLNLPSQLFGLSQNETVNFLLQHSADQYRAETRKFILWIFSAEKMRHKFLTVIHKDSLINLVEKLFPSVLRHHRKFSGLPESNPAKLFLTESSKLSFMELMGIRAFTGVLAKEEDSSSIEQYFGALLEIESGLTGVSKESIAESILQKGSITRNRVESKSNLLVEELKHVARVILDIGKPDERKAIIPVGFDPKEEEINVDFKGAESLMDYPFEYLRDTMDFILRNRVLPWWFQRNLFSKPNSGESESIESLFRIIASEASRCYPIRTMKFFESISKSKDFVFNLVFDSGLNLAKQLLYFLFERKFDILKEIDGLITAIRNNFSDHPDTAFLESEIVYILLQKITIGNTYRIDLIAMLVRRFGFDLEILSEMANSKQSKLIRSEDLHRYSQLRKADVPRHDWITTGRKLKEIKLNIHFLLSKGYPSELTNYVTLPELLVYFSNQIVSETLTELPEQVADYSIYNFTPIFQKLRSEEFDRLFYGTSIEDSFKTISVLISELPSGIFGLEDGVNFVRMKATACNWLLKEFLRSQSPDAALLSAFGSLLLLIHPKTLADTPEWYDLLEFTSSSILKLSKRGIKANVLYRMFEKINPELLKELMAYNAGIKELLTIVDVTEDGETESVQLAAIDKIGQAAQWVRGEIPVQELCYPDHILTDLLSFIARRGFLPWWTSQSEIEADVSILHKTDRGQSILKKNLIDLAATPQFVKNITANLSRLTVTYLLQALSEGLGDMYKKTSEFIGKLSSQVSYLNEAVLENSLLSYLFIKGQAEQKLSLELIFQEIFDLTISVSLSAEVKYGEKELLKVLEIFEESAGNLPMLYSEHRTELSRILSQRIIDDIAAEGWLGRESTPIDNAESVVNDQRVRRFIEIFIGYELQKGNLQIVKLLAQSDTSYRQFDELVYLGEVIRQVYGTEKVIKESGIDKASEHKVNIKEEEIIIPARYSGRKDIVAFLGDVFSAFARELGKDVFLSLDPENFRKPISSEDKAIILLNLFAATKWKNRKAEFIKLHKRNKAEKLQEVLEFLIQNFEDCVLRYSAISESDIPGKPILKHADSDTNLAEQIEQQPNYSFRTAAKVGKAFLQKSRKPAFLAEVVKLIPEKNLERLRTDMSTREFTSLPAHDQFVFMLLDLLQSIGKDQYGTLNELRKLESMDRKGEVRNEDLKNAISVLYGQFELKTKELRVYKSKQRKPEMKLIKSEPQRLGDKVQVREISERYPGRGIDWAEPLKAEDKIYITNAGMILLWPYISGFMKRQGLIEANKFKDRESREKAICLLQYMVTGIKEYPNFLMQLNKVFFNTDVAFPVDENIVISDDLYAECDMFVEAIMQQWPVMKRTSLQGFRESFLMRKGILMRQKEDWSVKVEHTSIDVLLTTLPWGISMIKFPWNEYTIYTEWN